MANLDKAKQILRKTLPPLPSFRPDKELGPEDVKAAREYIANYWTKVQRFHPKDDESLLGLPKPYLVPSYRTKTGFDYNELYYWDSYFMVQGMLDEEHQELVCGILENLESLFKRYKVIPNASRTYLTGRSQPPLLTAFIFDIHQSYNLGEDWLKKSMAVAQKEYETVWMGVKKPNERQVYKGLSRYYDINYLHDLAEAESGWDMTPRFDRRALNYLPVDLNALLYKYETDFARVAKLSGNMREAAQWEDRAELRKQTMNSLMWDRIRGLYYDYNFVKEKRGNVSSLATYFPMWAGMVDEKQAAALVKALRRFEHKGGLSTTDALPLGQFVLGSLPTQWAYPNGWAPLHFIVVKALERYGYHREARRIAMKWLKTNLMWFNTEHVFLEKYNVVAPEKPPLKGLYPSQTGFGWTNAVFERFCQDYVDRPE
ncbi:MAG TPA: trehalase family glycosidase [Candidatus Saccharimonadales bacterium]|jgi:alpha,alpha-trehalase|nr:trehalase family glycosidase [Candidatus Saccharimonadales bacterium]